MAKGQLHFFTTTFCLLRRPRFFPQGTNLHTASVRLKPFPSLNGPTSLHGYSVPVLPCPFLTVLYHFRPCPRLVFYPLIFLPLAHTGGIASSAGGFVVFVFWSVNNSKKKKKKKKKTGVVAQACLIGPIDPGRLITQFSSITCITWSASIRTTDCWELSPCNWASSCLWMRSFSDMTITVWRGP